MGYCTCYSLSLKSVDQDEAYTILEDLAKDCEDAKYALDDEGKTNESVKWYDHEKDLKEFSKKYPEVLFELSGEGEESDDIWKKYFLNGKVQLCSAQIIFPEFDPRKLS
jgi:flavoprotein